MRGLVRFMNGALGSAGRIGLGIALIVAGVLVGGIVGILLALVGVGPIVLGVSRRCLLETLPGMRAAPCS